MLALLALLALSSFVSIHPACVQRACPCVLPISEPLAEGRGAERRAWAQLERSSPWGSPATLSRPKPARSIRAGTFEQFASLTEFSIKRTSRTQFYDEIFTKSSEKIQDLCLLFDYRVYKKAFLCLKVEFPL